MKRITKIIAVALVFVVVFGCFKFVISNAIMKKANYGMENLLECSDDIDDVFIGSSMFRQGIDASTFDGDSEKSYVLAYNGNQPIFEYYQMKYLFDNGLEIENIYIDMYGFALLATPSISDVRMVQGTPLSFDLQLYNVIKEYDDADLTDLFELIVSANNETFITSPISMTLINSRYERGSNLGQTVGKTADELGEMQKNYNDMTEFNDVQTEYLTKLIDLCNENGVHVTLVETPKYYLNYTNDIYTTIMTQYVAFAKDLDCSIIMSSDTVEACGVNDETSSKIKTYDFDTAEASNFIDWIHMSYAGRISFSQILKEIVQQ